jgi:hypothetical protein
MVDTIIHNTTQGDGYIFRPVALIPQLWEPDDEG